MKYLAKIFFLCYLSLSFVGCSSDENDAVVAPVNYKYLALGDSYTYGQSVCTDCRFPEQLKDSLREYLNVSDTFDIKLIAQTGWTTTSLKAAIASETVTNDYDLVTVLIGVNNQFQGRPFYIYEQEFPELINTAISKAKGDKNKVIVVSIPDYAYTPYGQGSIAISEGVYAYNEFARNYCLANDITFVNITDITRAGLLQPELVASDGLHPSTIAYSKFVERILPEAKIKLGL